MTRTYETMVLLDNREVKKGWDTLKSEVASLFEKHGAKVVSARRWDERRLAYPIKGQLRATYLLMYLSAPTESIVSINRELQYAEPVLRHLTTVCEEVPEEAYQPEAEFDLAAIPDDGAADAPASSTEAEASDAKTEEAKSEDAKSEGKDSADGATAEDSGDEAAASDAESATEDAKSEDGAATDGGESDSSTPADGEEKTE